MTDSWQQVFAHWPILGTIYEALWIVIPLSCMLAYAGIIFLSAIARMLSCMRNRPAFDKCSRQLALFGLILGWLLLICGRVWLYYTQERHASGSMENYILEMSWMLLSLGVLLSSVYYTLWRVLKNMPILHVTLGIISAVQNCLAMAAILFCCRFMEATARTDIKDGIYELFPFDWREPVWSAMGQTVPLILAMAAAFGVVWMLLRRKQDDFGRDYYNMMPAWCAVWARNCWLLVWLLAVATTGYDLWMAFEKGAFSEQDAIVQSSRILLWLLPLLLWTIFLKAKIRLRQRWAVYLALPLAMAFALPYYLELTFL